MASGGLILNIHSPEKMNPNKKLLLAAFFFQVFAVRKLTVF